MQVRSWFSKWGLYGLALLLVYLAQVLVTDRVLLFGVRPDLIPVAIVAVAILEGAAGGAGFGLAAGLFYMAAFYNAGILAIVLFPLAGLLVGMMAEHVLQNNFLSCFACTLAFFLFLELWRVVPHFLADAPLGALLRIALPELLYSLLCAIPVYVLFRAVRRKVSGSRI